MRGTNFKRYSLIYQKFNFDLFYRQINITLVRGPLHVRLDIKIHVKRKRVTEAKVPMSKVRTHKPLIHS